MTAVYFDTSAYLKLLLDDEVGRDVVLDLWEAATVAASSRLADIEVRAGLGAAHRTGRLTAAGRRGAELRWERYWAESRPIELTEAVGGRAGALAIRHALTGADAVHLASAEVLGTAIMATWDRRLGAAAAAVGLAVVPAA
ncbi:MAG: conserved hypothetical alanine rich protein [Actinomycetia bacterium]|nr:conserved hypothetical alanine rich protein [Actinomycetes bacterium]